MCKRKTHFMLRCRFLSFTKDAEALQMPLEVWPIGSGRARHIVFRRTNTWECESVCGIKGTVRVTIKGDYCNQCRKGMTKVPVKFKKI